MFTCILWQCLAYKNRTNYSMAPHSGFKNAFQNIWQDLSPCSLCSEAEQSNSCAPFWLKVLNKPGNMCSFTKSIKLSTPQPIYSFSRLDSQPFAVILGVCFLLFLSHIFWNEQRLSEVFLWGTNMWLWRSHNCFSCLAPAGIQHLLCLVHAGELASFQKASQFLLFRVTLLAVVIPPCPQHRSFGKTSNYFCATKNSRFQLNFNLASLLGSR